MVAIILQGFALVIMLWALFRVVGQYVLCLGSGSDWGFKFRGIVVEITYGQIDGAPLSCYSAAPTRGQWSDVLSPETHRGCTVALESLRADIARRGSRSTAIAQAVGLISFPEPRPVQASS